MIPKSLSITNILPFAGTHSISFEGIGAAVISGANGGGKSSFFVNALELALFGSARDVANDELICDGYDKGGLTFVFGHNGKTYAVVRELQRGKTQTLKLFAFEEGKENDGIDLSDRLLKNTQATLNDVIGFSQELLFNTAIAPQDQVNRLSLLSPSEREAILSEMLGLGIWEKKKKRAQERLNEQGDVLKKCEEIELSLDVLIGNLREREEKIALARIEYAKIQNEYDKAYAQFEALRQEFMARENRLLLKQQLGEHLTVLKTEIQTLKLNIEKEIVPDPAAIQERLENVEQDIIECQQLIAQIDQQMATVRDNIKAWSDKESEVARLRQQETQLSILNEVPCGGTDFHRTCPLLQVAQGTKKQIDAFVAGQQQAAYSLEQVQANARQQRAEWEKRYHTFNDNKVQLNNRIANLKNQKEKLEGSIGRAEDVKRWTQLMANKELLLRQKQSEYDSIDVTWNNDAYVELQTHCTRLSSVVGHLKASIESDEQASRNDRDSIGALEGQLSALIPQKNKAANLKTLIQAYSDIPTLLFTNTIPYVEAYANEFLLRLSVDRRLYLRPYRDTKSGTQVKTLDVIGTTSTGTRSFKNLSGSEKFRESLALRIALSKVNAELYNTQIGFFIIDEGFGSLDEINVLLIKNALREAAKDFDLFLVISHVPELVDTFPKRILVRPSGKGKRVEVVEHAATADVALDI